MAERGIPVTRKTSRLTGGGWSGEETGGESVTGPGPEVLAGALIGGAGDGVRLGERLKGAMNLRKRDEDIGREDRNPLCFDHLGVFLKRGGGFSSGEGGM